MPSKAFKHPKERIICACFPISFGGAYLIPIEILPMDFYASECKRDPLFKERASPTTRFVTNHGRHVNDHEAFKIAANAGQIEETRTKGRLCTTDLWPL